MDVVLRPLHESGRWFSEMSGEVRVGVSYSIYELKNYSEVCTTYIREGEHEAMTGKVGAPDVVVLDLTVWKVPEDPLMLDTESTTFK